MARTKKSKKKVSAEKKQEKKVITKKVSKKAIKASVKKQKVEKIPEMEEVIPVDWKIPAAFLAGIIITALFYNLTGLTALTGTETTVTDTTNNIPVESDDAEVSLVVLNDADCPICDDSWIEPRVLMDFPNVNVNYVDINSAIGQEYVDDLSITSVPAAFFASDVEQAGNFSMYAEYNWIVPFNGFYILNIEGTKSLIEQETSEPTVDVYVMSECPYGVPAQLNMINAKELIPDFVLNMHYIGNVYTETEWNSLSADYQQYYEAYGMCEQKSNNKYYCSLHGPEEVEIDIIQLCAMSLYPDTWTEFVKAHIDNNFDVSLAVEGTSFDETLIMNCANSETGWNLYEEDIEVAEQNNIGASPTYVFDNVITANSGIMTQGPAGLLCTLHPELSGCESITTLEVTQATGSC